MNRRQALGAFAGAALLALRPRSAEAQAEGPTFFASSLQQEQLEQQKLTVVDELINGLWDQLQVREYAARSFFGGSKDRADIRGKLGNESKMYVPTAQKSIDVLNRNREQLKELSSQIPESKFGLFLDGDEQALYVLQNIGQNRIQFVKGYSVSTSKSEWSNAPDSRGTPLGLHRVAYGQKGMLGELVSSPKRGPRDFTQLTLREKGVSRKKTFVKSLVSSGDAVAEIITASLLITGPETRSTRGIYIHGTNRVDKLGGYDSGGCIRTSNVDIYDLLKYVEIGKLQKDECTVVGGTPVSISATTDPKNSRGIYPPRWKPAVKSETQSKERIEIPKEQPELSTPDIPGYERGVTRPPRWTPPKK